MKTIATWLDVERFGIVYLTGEACSLMYRVLCDLTSDGKRIVERALGVEIRSENWNSGSADRPHVASIMLTREMLLPLGVFCLLESGCREVWLIESAVLGIEETDSDTEIQIAETFYKPTRRFRYTGPHQDRNQHQMSGRVR